MSLKTLKSSEQLIIKADAIKTSIIVSVPNTLYRSVIIDKKIRIVETINPVLMLKIICILVLFFVSEFVPPMNGNGLV